LTDPSAQFRREPVFRGEETGVSLDGHLLSEVEAQIHVRR
jgi:hypothetical protein